MVDGWLIHCEHFNEWLIILNRVVRMPNFSLLFWLNEHPFPVIKWLTWGAQDAHYCLPRNILPLINIISNHAAMITFSCEHHQ